MLALSLSAPVTVPEAAPGITGKIKALPIPTHWLRNLLLTVGSLGRLGLCGLPWQAGALTNKPHSFCVSSWP